MIKTYRAWLNDDPNSDETTDFTLPEDTILERQWTRRLFHYQHARNAHVKQMCTEIAALKHICQAGRLPKDIYNLLKNDYIKRRVKKLPDLNAEPFYDSDVFIYTLMAFLGFLVVLAIAHTIYAHVGKSEMNTNYNVCGIGQFDYPGPPGIVGPAGPPGICLSKSTDTYPINKTIKT